jgi:1-acyl-sn-glycerol-3-phosphate acyltransferase
MPNLQESLIRSRLFRKFLYSTIGAITYPFIAIRNKIKIEGTEHIEHLPHKNVLFISNHQTYFADVITFIHIFCAVKWRKRNKLGVPYYLLNPFAKIYYVAASETMKQTTLSKLFTLAGAITVKRTWNPDHKETRKGLDPSDTRKVTRALDDNWVITFPQGTTTPYAPGRKGTALIAKMAQPIIIPVVIDGFRTAFGKKGIALEKRTTLTVRFKPPMQYTAENTTDELLALMMDAIEQSEKFKPEK